MKITVLLKQEGEYVRARAQSFFTEEFFGFTREQALAFFYTGLFTYLALQIDLDEVKPDDVKELSFDILDEM